MGNYFHNSQTIIPARQVAENYNAIPQDVPIDPRDPLAFQKRVSSASSL